MITAFLCAVNAFIGKAAVFSVDVNADIPPPDLYRRQACRAAPDERVKHDTARRTACQYARFG